MKGRGRLSDILVPVLLAVLTVTVFARLQYCGPDSAFRRFYQAALAGDRRGVNDATVEGASSAAVRELVVQIQNFRRMGVRPQTLGMRVSAKGAIVDTVYIDPSTGLKVYIPWVVRSHGRTWQLSAEDTLAKLSLASGQ